MCVFHISIYIWPRACICAYSHTYTSPRVLNYVWVWFNKILLSTGSFIIHCLKVANIIHGGCGWTWWRKVCMYKQLAASAAVRLRAAVWPAASRKRDGRCRTTKHFCNRGSKQNTFDSFIFKDSKNVSSQLPFGVRRDYMFLV